MAPFWGDTFCLSQIGPCDAGDGYSHAILGTERTPGEQYVALSYDDTNLSWAVFQDYLAKWNGWVDIDDASHTDFASALVRAVPSPVPVPAAVWLFGTALIGLIGFGKRKSRIAA